MLNEYFGRGALNKLPEALTKINAQHVLLITGKNSYIKSGAKSLIDDLLTHYTVTHFNDFTSNPDFQQAIAGAQLCSKEKCDAIVAVGGGSVIDIAKSINAFYTHKGNELNITTGKEKISNKLLPLIAIPTTAGTGSEATHFSVIYKNKTKYSIASPSLLPDIAIIDPSLTDNLPSYITACTGFDAFSQAIESYWSLGSTPESKKYAAEAIPIINANLIKSITSENKETRDNMSYAAHLAGKAINISKTTAPHALSYAITTKTGLPHGHAVAITLGNFFTINKKAATFLDKDKQHYFEKTMQCLFFLLEVSSAEEAKQKWYDMMEDCGLEIDVIPQKTSPKTLINEIINHVNLERLANHPVKLSPELMRKVFPGINKD